MIRCRKRHSHGDIVCHYYMWPGNGAHSFCTTPRPADPDKVPQHTQYTCHCAWPMHLRDTRQLGTPHVPSIASANSHQHPSHALLDKARSSLRCRRHIHCAKRQQGKTRNFCRYRLQSASGSGPLHTQHTYPFHVCEQTCQHCSLCTPVQRH